MTTKAFLTLFAIVSITIGAASCKKDNTNTSTTTAEIETTFEATENQAVADNLNQDDGEVLEEAAARNGLLGGINGCGGILTNSWIGNCAVVTVTGAFPTKNIKINFGTSCTFPTGINGVTRRGVINILLTDSLRAINSKATITFDNYYVNGFKREGTIVRTNTTQAGASTRSHNRTVVGGKITAPDGRFWLHSANLDITQTEGVTTVCDIRDDVYTIFGTRITTNAQGKTRTSTTQTALQKKASCENIDQGILKIQGPNHFAILDFGNGTCDRLATISIDERPARTILLR